jgi:cytoskeletal protein RodZ
MLLSTLLKIPTESRHLKIYTARAAREKRGLCTKLRAFAPTVRYTLIKPRSIKSQKDTKKKHARTTIRDAEEDGDDSSSSSAPSIPETGTSVLFVEQQRLSVDGSATSSSSSSSSWIEIKKNRKPSCSSLPIMLHDQN